MSDLDTVAMAEKLGTTARTLRKFLRSDDSPYERVGQGSRYLFSEEDIPELQELFSAWAEGHKTTPSGGGGRKKGSRPRRSPIDKDDLLVRTSSTIVERQRAHGLICGFVWRHPTVKGLETKCRNKPEPGSRFCRRHPQVDYCGDVDEPRCGPEKHGVPWCRYHGGDMSEEEFERLLDETA